MGNIHIIHNLQDILLGGIKRIKMEEVTHESQRGVVKNCEKAIFNATEYFTYKRERCTPYHYPLINPRLGPIYSIDVYATYVITCRLEHLPNNRLIFL